MIRGDPASGAQTVVSVGGSLAGAGGLALEPDGDILVTVPGGVVRVDPVTGAQTVVFSGGHLISPVDLALEPDGDIVVADRGEPPIWGDETPGGHSDGRVIRGRRRLGGEIEVEYECQDKSEPARALWASQKNARERS